MWARVEASECIMVSVGHRGGHVGAKEVFPGFSHYMTGGVKEYTSPGKTPLVWS